MKTLFFGISLAVANLVRFDTQDQISKVAFENEWKHTNQAHYLVFREKFNGKDVLRVHTRKRTKKIFLYNFQYNYRVKKVSSHEFIIYCKNWNSYWNDTDIINILFKH